MSLSFSTDIGYRSDGWGGPSTQGAFLFAGADRVLLVPRPTRARGRGEVRAACSTKAVKLAAPKVFCGALFDF